MTSPRSSPGTLRERSFLVLGLGAALVLLLAALVGGGDPESAGRAELVSTAARIAEAVKVEWQDLPAHCDWVGGTSIGDDRCHGLVKPAINVGTPLSRLIEGTELVPDTGSGHAIFDALIVQSERVELVDGDLSGALDMALEALQKTTDPARRAAARLRAVQLGAKASRPDLAQDQYRSACGELDGSERRGEVSYRILLALSVATALDDAGRKDLGEQLLVLYHDRKLGWIVPPARVSLAATAAEKPGFVEDSGVAALLGLMGELSPTLATEFEADRRQEAFMAAVGSLPDNDTPRMMIRHTPAGFFGWWSSLPPSTKGGFLSADTVTGALRGQLHGSGVVTSGFVVDIDPPASKASAVREHEVLDGDFGFTVKHEDPEGWIRRSAAKQKLLRAALLVLALLSAAAGVATFRALRRERTLAALKTDFVANVSHELRTPLASILLLSENLEASRVASEADKSRYHTLIRREALRLRRLVDDVLDFSRLERGKRIDIHREGLRVDPWLERTCEELAEWAREHALELAIERSPTEAEAEIDAEALRRALLNLLDNARKHSGGSRVDLITLREGRELVLRVRDHGRGISAEDRERVFEPFMRLANGDAPGAGLGLSIVREIAREHCGSVRALDPADGPGIVFEMRIPLVEEPAA